MYRYRVLRRVEWQPVRGGGPALVNTMLNVNLVLELSRLNLPLHQWMVCSSHGTPHAALLSASHSSHCSARPRPRRVPAQACSTLNAHSTACVATHLSHDSCDRGSIYIRVAIRNAGHATPHHARVALSPRRPSTCLLTAQWPIPTARRGGWIRLDGASWDVRSWPHK